MFHYYLIFFSLYFFIFSTTKRSNNNNNKTWITISNDECKKFIKLKVCLFKSTTKKRERVSLTMGLIIIIKIIVCNYYSLFFLYYYILLVLVLLFVLFLPSFPYLPLYIVYCCCSFSSFDFRLKKNSLSLSLFLYNLI